MLDEAGLERPEKETGRGTGGGEDVAGESGREDGDAEVGDPEPADAESDDEVPEEEGEETRRSAMSGKAGAGEEADVSGDGSESGADDEVETGKRSVRAGSGGGKGTSGGGSEGNEERGRRLTGAESVRDMRVGVDEMSREGEMKSEAGRSSARRMRPACSKRESARLKYEVECEGLRGRVEDAAE